MQKNKRIYFAAAAALFFAAAMTAEGEQAQLGEAKEKRLYASFPEMQAYVSAQPTGIVPVGECYAKKDYEMGLDEGILADLQGYVLQGDFDGALDAYREEELLIDSGELLTICPEFAGLMEEWAAKINPSFADYWTDTDNIYQIYALDLDEKEGKEILFWYEVSNSIFLLHRTEEGYCVAPAGIDTWSYDLYGARDARQMVIFSGEENTYYLLADKPSGGDGARSALAGLVLVRFRLKDVWDTGCFAYESRLIAEDRAAVSVRYLYADNRNVCMHRVKEYIEENAALFGYKLQEEEIIWGDEEMPQSGKEEQKKIVQSQVDDLSNYAEENLLDWYVRSYVVCADYDNDGKGELFWRDDEGRNRLLVEADGGYGTEYVNLYGENACPVNQMWFVEFTGGTVTFEITELYGREYPVLSAYLIEGNERVPIVTCQLVYEEAVLIEQQRSSYGRNDFGVQKVLTLFDGFEEAEEAANVWWTENLEEQWEESKGVFSVTYTQKETQLSEGLLALIRQEYARILSGETESCLEPYTLETEEDRKAFLQYSNWKQGWEYEYGSYAEELCDWAYRWESSDGTVNYLAGIDGGGTLGAVALEWYQDAGEGMEYQGDLGSYFRGDDSRIITYEDKVYCVSTAYDFETKALTGMDILVLGEAGEWEGYSISLSVNAEESSAELLYCGEMGEAVFAYVEEVYKEVLADSAERRIFTGRGESGRIPQDAARLLKNLGEHFDYYAGSGDVSPYRAADVDNDGEAEYFRTYYYYPSSYHQDLYLVCAMYGWREEGFGEILFDEIIEDLSPYRGLLWQLWFEEFDGKTYLFTVEGLPNSQNCLLRVRLIEDGGIEETGVFMLQAMLMEEISRNE